MDKISGQDVIIGIGGSFNPIHEQHIGMLLAAKSFLEDECHMNVVAGMRMFAKRMISCFAPTLYVCV